MAAHFDPKPFIESGQLVLQGITTQIEQRLTLQISSLYHFDSSSLHVNDPEIRRLARR
jgi:hypothetical protein